VTAIKLTHSHHDPLSHAFTNAGFRPQQAFTNAKAARHATLAHICAHVFFLSTDAENAQVATALMHMRMSTPKKDGTSDMAIYE